MDRAVCRGPTGSRGGVPVSESDEGGLLDAEDSRSSPSSSPRNLSNNKVSEIEDGTFEGATSVSELHLTANQLESVRSGMFRGLDGLRTL